MCYPNDPNAALPGLRRRQNRCIRLVVDSHRRAKRERNAVGRHPFQIRRRLPHRIIERNARPPLRRRPRRRQPFFSRGHLISVQSEVCLKGLPQNFGHLRTRYTQHIRRVLSILWYTNAKGAPDVKTETVAKEIGSIYDDFQCRMRRVGIYAYGICGISVQFCGPQMRIALRT